jgi:hypothetical protein
MNAPLKSHIQGPQNRTHGPRQYMALQDIIFDETGVSCTVVLKGGIVSIRTKDYADYILARAALKGRTSSRIIRDVFYE